MKFKVKPTKDREGARDDYIVCVNPVVKKKLNLGSHAVVVYEHPKIGREIKAPCRVIIEKSLKEDEVRVDQTVRNAIGIRFEYDKEKTRVKIYPLHLTNEQKLMDFISHILGRRYLFFRVNKADITDLEKNLCRIPEDAFIILGCKEGDKIICESPVFDGNKYILKRFKIKAFSASKEMIKRREKNEKEHPERFPPAKEKLEVDLDIPRIFLDAHARESLSVELLDPLKVRRDLQHLFLKQIREFGIISLLSILAATKVFPLRSSWSTFGLVLLFSLILSLLLVFINIRSEIK